MAWVVPQCPRLCCSWPAWCTHDRHDHLFDSAVLGKLKTVLILATAAKLIKMTRSQFSANNYCTTKSIEELKEIDLTRGITAIIYAIIVALILVFLLCNRAYKQRTERLLLYLLFGTAVTEVIKALGMEYQFEYSHQEKVCKWLAFFMYWSSCTMFTFTFGIIINFI